MMHQIGMWMIGSSAITLAVLFVLVELIPGKVFNNRAANVIAILSGLSFYAGLAMLGM